MRTAEWPGPELEFQQPEPRSTEAGTPTPGHRNRDAETGTPELESTRIGDRGPKKQKPESKSQTGTRHRRSRGQENKSKTG